MFAAIAAAALARSAPRCPPEKSSVFLSARRIAAAARLEQKPDPPLRLVDPDFEQARRRDVAVLLADAVRLAHVRGEAHVVLAQLRQHVEGRDVVSVIVENA